MVNLGQLSKIAAKICPSAARPRSEKIHVARRQCQRLLCGDDDWGVQGFPAGSPGSLRNDCWAEKIWGGWTPKSSKDKDTLSIIFVLKATVLRRFSHILWEILHLGKWSNEVKWKWNILGDETEGKNFEEKENHGTNNWKALTDSFLSQNITNLTQNFWERCLPSWSTERSEFFSTKKSWDQAVSTSRSWLMAQSWNPVSRLG